MVVNCGADIQDRRRVLVGRGAVCHPRDITVCTALPARELPAEMQTRPELEQVCLALPDQRRQRLGMASE